MIFSCSLHFWVSFRLEYIDSISRYSKGATIKCYATATISHQKKVAETLGALPSASEMANGKSSSGVQLHFLVDLFLFLIMMGIDGSQKSCDMELVPILATIWIL